MSRVSETLPISGTEILMAVWNTTGIGMVATFDYARSTYPTYFDPMYDNNTYAPQNSALRFRNFGPPANPPTYNLEYVVDNSLHLVWFEGESITITLNTTNVVNGTQFTLTINAANVGDASFNPSITDEDATLTIQNNTATVKCYGLKDIFTESVEVINFNLTTVGGSSSLDTLSVNLHNPPMTVVLSHVSHTNWYVQLSWALTSGLIEEVARFYIYRANGLNALFSDASYLADFAPSTTSYYDWSVNQAAPYTYWVKADRYDGSDILSNKLIGWANLEVSWSLELFTAYDAPFSNQWKVEIKADIYTNFNGATPIGLKLRPYSDPNNGIDYNVTWGLTPTQEFNSFAVDVQNTAMQIYNNSYAYINIIPVNITYFGFHVLPDAATSSQPFLERYARP